MKRLTPVRLILVTVTLCASAHAQGPQADGSGDAPAAAAKATSPAPSSPPAAVPRPGPSPYSPTVQKGDSAYIARDFDGAIAAYRQEIEKNPNGPLGHYRMGEAELAKGNFAEAEESWQTALRFAEKDPHLKGKILFLLADLKERQKAYDDSVERWKTYQQFLESSPEAKGYPATAADRIKRAEEWKKLSADSAEVKARIEKRIKEADESMRKSSK
ncbi:MAG TPA: tetratricopeptide repeat protein [Polyangiaceae bacterium]|nr:tetratricopeptide repeat protein [Polyangiaceae bacterium]